MTKKTEVISPDAYPQMVSKAQALLMSRALSSHIAVANGKQVIEDSGEVLRAAVRAYVEDLEKAGMNYELVMESAHEIRGLAETAGMRSTGRIADGLCHYFDEASQSAVKPDAAVVALHVSAISNTARNMDAASQMSDVVARELAALAGKKLAEARKAARNS